MITNEEIQVIYRKSVKKVYRFFYYKFLSKEIAEDLTSETFIKFVDLVRRRNDIESYEAFVFGIAKNIFLKKLEAKYKEPINGIEDQLENISIEEFVQSVDRFKDKKKLIMNLLDKIPEKQSVVLRLMVEENLNVREVSNRIGKDTNYVRTTQNRGIKSLKNLIFTTQKL